MKYGLGYYFITKYVTTFLGRRVFYFRQVESDYMLEFIENDGSKILDLGCNDGFFANVIKNQNPSCKVYGADINECALNLAKKRYPEIKFYKIGADFYKKKKFNVIIVSHVLEHIRDRKNFLRNISNILTKRGKLLLAVPQERIRGDMTILQWLYNLLRGSFENPHVVKLKYKDVKTLFKQVGLKPTNKIYANCISPFKSKTKKIHSMSLVVIASKK